MAVYMREIRFRLKLEVKLEFVEEHMVLSLSPPHPFL